MNNEKSDPLYVQMIHDIDKFYPDPEENKRVKALLEKSEEQTQKKQIQSIRRPAPVKNFLARWEVRFKYGIHWSKPFYPLRLIRNYGIAFLYGKLGKNKHIARGVEFATTYKCNFNCSHCLCTYLEESSQKNELEPEEYKRIVKEAMKIGAVTFGMEGGEPFVKKNWVEILESWQPRYNHIQISSNGYLFDEKKARKCAEIGVDTINFSLDSGIPELHDLFRRKRGSFNRVMRAIDLCNKYKIKVILNTTVHTGNLYTEGFIKLLEFSEANHYLVNMLFAKGVGSFKGNKGMLSQKDYENFDEIVKPYNYWSVHHAGTIKSSHGGEGCPGLKEMINMTPYGDVLTCANNHIYLGNVRDEPLSVIRERGLERTPFGRYHQCFLAQDKDFMNVYYPLIDGKHHVSINEFISALEKYEAEVGRKIYPEIYKP